MINASVLPLLLAVITRWLHRQDLDVFRYLVEENRDDTELFKQFMDNEGFRRWLTDTVFGITYEQRP